MKFKESLNDFRNWLNAQNDPTPTEAIQLNRPNSIAWIKDVQRVINNETQNLILNLNTGDVRTISNLNDMNYLCKTVKGTITNLQDLIYVPWNNQTKRIENLNIRRFTIPSHGSFNEIQIKNCWIDSLELIDDCDVNISLIDTFVGKFRFRQKCIHHLKWNGGAILSIRCDTPDNRNPFTGHVYFGNKKFYLPSKDDEYKGEKSTPQPWTNIRAHLMALDNIEAAGLFHSVEQRISGPLLPPLTRFSNFLYGLFSDYGNSLTRPLLGILLASLISFFLFIPSGSLSPAKKDIEWVTNACNFTSAAWTSIDPIINPIGILNDSDYFEPTSLGLAIFHTFDRFFIVAMIFFFFLALRRKFRITA